MFDIVNYQEATGSQLRKELNDFYNIVYKESKSKDVLRAERAELLLSMFPCNPNLLTKAQVESMRGVMAMKEPGTLRDFAEPINRGALKEEGVIRVLSFLSELEDET